jgi:DNA-binding PadR family transcriptional regulator
MSEAHTVSGTQRTANDLTAFQYNILVILAKEPMYGLAIKRELEEYYETEVNHGRLYPNLDDLVERGLVEKSELDKRTNQYDLTDDGYTTVLGQLEWVFANIVTDEDRADDVRELVGAQTQ